MEKTNMLNNNRNNQPISPIIGGRGSSAASLCPLDNLNRAHDSNRGDLHTGLRKRRTVTHFSLHHLPSEQPPLLGAGGSLRLPLSALDNLNRAHDFNRGNPVRRAPVEIAPYARSRTHLSNTARTAFLFGKLGRGIRVRIRGAAFLEPMPVALCDEREVGLRKRLPQSSWRKTPASRSAMRAVSVFGFCALRHRPAWRHCSICVTHSISERPPGPSFMSDGFLARSFSMRSFIWRISAACSFVSAWP